MKYILPSLKSNLLALFFFILLLSFSDLKAQQSKAQRSYVVQSDSAKQSDSAQQSDSVQTALPKQAEWFIEGGRETGLIFNPAYVSKINLPAHIEGFDLKIGKHTSGTQPWQESFRRPIIGVGLTSDYAFKAHQYGSFGAAYFFFLAPIILRPSSKLQIHYIIGFGLAKNWNPSSVPFALQMDVHHQNIFTSSSFAIYLRFGMEASYRLNNNLDVLGSISLSHFSNGSIQAPNPGVTMLNENLGLRYYFRPIIKSSRKYQLMKQEITKVSIHTNSDAYWILPPDSLRFSSTKNSSSSKFNAINEFFASGSLSIKQVDTHASYFLIESIQAGFTHQYATKFKWGIAADVFYNPSIAAYVRGPVTRSTYFSSGIYAFHEVVIHQFSLLLGEGVYLNRPAPFKRAYYDRFGYKYSFNKSPINFVSMTINAHVLCGNFIEFTTGFKLYRFKNQATID